jgi:hypothetical protein
MDKPGVRLFFVILTGIIVMLAGGFVERGQLLQLFVILHY